MRSSYGVFDGFCGAGGTSVGAWEVGIPVETAINHNASSLATHRANFPEAAHLCVDITTFDPRSVALSEILACSPECTFHSTSSGVSLTGQGQMALPGWDDGSMTPAIERSRLTMWEVVRLATLRAEYGFPYQLILTENVPQVTLWHEYTPWLKAMLRLGYSHRTLYFNSMFAPPEAVAPIPQSRDRWYTLFWREGNPVPDLDLCPPAYCSRCAGLVASVQSWKPMKRTRKKARQQGGAYKKQYVYHCPRHNCPVEPLTTPVWTVLDWDQPAPRVGDRPCTVGGHHYRALSASTRDRIQVGLNRYCTRESCRSYKEEGGESQGIRSVLGPACTQTTAQSQALAIPPGAQRAFIASYYGGSDCLSPVTDPVGTLTTHDRHGLVLPDPEMPVPTVEDCGYRVLSAEECRRIQGFPEGYRFCMADGSPATQREQVRQIGHAVTPGVAAELFTRLIATLGYTQDGSSYWTPLYQQCVA